MELREKLVWRAMVLMLLAVVAWLSYLLHDQQGQLEAQEAALAEKAERIAALEAECGDD